MSDDISDESLKRMNLDELGDVYDDVVDFLVEANSRQGGAFVTISRRAKEKIAALPENQRTGFILQIQAGDSPRDITEGGKKVNPTIVTSNQIAESYKQSLRAKKTRQFMTDYIKMYRDGGDQTTIGYRLFKNAKFAIPDKCPFLLTLPKQVTGDKDPNKAFFER